MGSTNNSNINSNRNITEHARARLASPSERLGRR